MTAQLIKRLREQRMQWVDLDLPGKRVRLIRPTEIEIGLYFVKDGSVSVGVAEVERFTVDWEGFTEADLLGAAVGSSDAVPFSQALWAEVISDRSGWVRQLATELLDIVVKHGAEKKVDAKNS